jgi:succinate dehydrogenase / fumarate reductase cytochrome b subunit
MVQHLVLNSFTLSSPEKFNGVIGFFEGMPKGFLLLFEAAAIWIPLLFHAVYGMFIVGRAEPNFIGTKYGWSQNRMYTFQRWSGVFIFLFLAYHVLSTTGYKYYTGNAEVIEYAAWQQKLTSYGYIFFFIYMLGVAASAYHLAYGVWNFCIRWGITISDAAQIKVQKAAVLIFLGLTVLGWGALAGFLIHKPTNADPGERAALSQPTGPIPATNQG